MGNNHPLSKLYPDSIPFELICQYIKFNNKYCLNVKYLNIIIEHNDFLSAKFHLAVDHELVVHINLLINQSIIKLKPNIIQPKNPFKMKFHGGKTKVNFEIIENKLKGYIIMAKRDKINFTINDFRIINNDDKYSIVVE